VPITISRSRDAPLDGDRSVEPFLRTEIAIERHNGVPVTSPQMIRDLVGAGSCFREFCHHLNDPVVAFEFDQVPGPGIRLRKS
jgi:hypothetical protein